MAPFYTLAWQASDVTDFFVFSNSHELIKNLRNVRSVNTDLAALVVHQLYDNAMMSAGLLHDPRNMVGRLNSLLAKVLDSSN